MLSFGWHWYLIEITKIISRNDMLVLWKHNPAFACYSEKKKKIKKGKIISFICVIDWNAPYKTPANLYISTGLKEMRFCTLTVHQ